MHARHLVIPALALCGSLWLAKLAAASSGGNYVLAKETIDGGGGRAVGSRYVLTGTVGQPDAAVQAAGRYLLTGGFHGNGPAPNDTIFKNGFD